MKEFIAKIQESITAIKEIATGALKVLSVPVTKFLVTIVTLKSGKKVAHYNTTTTSLNMTFHSIWDGHVLGFEILKGKKFSDKNAETVLPLFRCLNVIAEFYGNFSHLSKFINAEKDYKYYYFKMPDSGLTTKECEERLTLMSKSVTIEKNKEAATKARKAASKLKAKSKKTSKAKKTTAKKSASKSASKSKTAPKKSASKKEAPVKPTTAKAKAKKS